MENTITINRPLEEVFEYVSTPENDPTWVSVSLRHQRTLPNPMRVGMTTQEDVKVLGRTLRDTSWEVIEYEPPTVIAYRATSGLASGAVVRIRCEPVEGGARLRHAVEYEPRGIYFKALAPLLPGVMRQMIASMDHTLKNLLEGDTPTPSGRPEAGAYRMTGSVAVGTGLAVFVALFFLLRRRNRSARG